MSDIGEGGEREDREVGLTCSDGLTGRRGSFFPSFLSLVSADREGDEKKMVELVQAMSLPGRRHAYLPSLLCVRLQLLIFKLTYHG